MLSKAFRLFVSSTFRDFEQERSLLQSKVFPALNAHCAAKGYQFHAIDLRWGVNDEAQLDHRTAEICLGEVALAKSYPSPNFLIMVGDRYGWVPLPFLIAQDEFEALIAWLLDRGRAEAVRNLSKMYRLDENYLVLPSLETSIGSREPISAYTLRSRKNDIPEFAPTDAWHGVENEMRNALQEAASHLFSERRISEMARAKYFLSLTEQEIIQGLPNFAPGDQDDERSVSRRLEIDESQCISWIKLEQPSLPTHTQGEASSSVERVKLRIREALPVDCVLSRHATRDWHGRMDEAYLEDFAASIEGQLKASIERRIAWIDAEERSAGATLLKERSHHRAFAEDRRNVFIGREGNRATIQSYIDSQNAHPLVLFGSSGLGKSSLMAQAIADTEKNDRTLPIVFRFIGASARSADLRSLLISIIEDLAAHGIVTTPDRWENDARKLDEQVRTLLKLINKAAVVFIDALDQLERPYRLGWLPDQLPAGLKIIVSALNDGAYEVDSGAYGALRRYLPADAFLEIEPVTRNQGDNILLALEESAGRKLRPTQRDYVLNRFEQAGASPLYLRVAFEITKSWKSWDEAGKGRCVLASNTVALIGQFIAELSSVHYHEPELVSRMLGYLVAAREGLSAKELTEVLSTDAEVMRSVSSDRHGMRTDKLPDSVWVRLNRQLAPLLMQKHVDEQTLLQFFHRQLTDVARERHYAPAKSTLHGALSDYFDAGLVTVDNEAIASGGRIYAKRSLSELPYQLFHSGKEVRLGEILTSLDWIQQKLHAFGGPYQLIADYQFATDQTQALVGRAIELSAHVLSRAPEQLGAQLWGRLFPDAQALLGKAIVPSMPEPTLSPSVPNLTLARNPVLRTLASHTQVVFKVVVGAASGHLFSCSADRTIKEWDWRTGELIDTYGPFEDGLRSLAVNSSESKLYGGLGVQWTDLFSKYGLIAWNSAGNSVLWNLSREQPTSAIALHPRIDFAVSAGWDGQLHFWRPSDGMSVRDSIEAHSEGINTLITDANWNVAFTGASDGRIRKWSLKDRAILADVEASEDYLLILALDGAGARLASGDSMGKVRVWDAGSIAPLVTCQTDDVSSGEVNSICYSPDGSKIVTGYSDHRLAIFDSATGALQCFRACSGPVMWVIFLDTDMFACAEGETIVILSLSSLQLSDQREDLRMRYGVEQIGAREGRDEVLCVGGGDLSLRFASTLETFGNLPIGVRRFVIKGGNAIVVCASSIMVLDLEQLDLNVVASFEIGSSWACDYVGVTSDSIVIVVTRLSDTVCCEALDLKRGQAVFALRATWEDPGLDMFRLTGGLGFLEHAERRSHETGYVRCDVAPDGACAIYFRSFQSVLFFNVRDGGGRNLNYVNYYGAASERRGAQACVGHEGGSLTGEYGLQRNNVIDLAFCIRNGRRSLAIFQPTTIEIVDCQTDANVLVRFENETLRGVSRAADGEKLVVLTTGGLRLLEPDIARSITLRDIAGLSRLWAANVASALAVCGGPFNSICLVQMNLTGNDRSYYLDASISCVHVDWSARRIMVGCSDGRMQVLGW